MGLGLPARRAAQAATALTGKVTVESAMAATQLRVHFIRQAIDQAILDNPGNHPAALRIQTADMEALPFAQAIEQRVVPAANIHGPRAQNAQSRPRTVGIEARAARVVGNPQRRHRPRQQRIVQLVKRQGAAQKLGDLFKVRAIARQRLLAHGAPAPAGNPPLCSASAWCSASPGSASSGAGCRSSPLCGAAPCRKAVENSAK